jgi:hypothetical protein
MVHRYKIDPSVNLLIDKFDGRYEWRDAFAGIMTSTVDPKFRSGMDVVVDLSTADQDFDFNDANSMAVQISEVPDLKFGRVAIVAPSALQFGIARMFGSLAEDRDIFADFRVFSNFSDARAWLNLPSDFEFHL